MRTLIGLALGTLLLTGVATGGDAKKDAEKLQGKWAGVTKGVKLELAFAKDTFTITFNGKSTSKGTFKVDPTKKPREMDMPITEGEVVQGKTALAIYELEGDTLKWCVSEPGKEARPKEFTDGPNQLSITLKRVK